MFKKNYSNRRWTLDFMKDFLFLKKVLKHFSKNNFFSWKDLINAEKVNKDLINIKKIKMNKAKLKKKKFILGTANFTQTYGIQPTKYKL